jgi:hypothetical protein
LIVYVYAQRNKSALNKRIEKENYEMVRLCGLDGDFSDLRGKLAVEARENGESWKGSELF